MPYSNQDYTTIDPEIRLAAILTNSFVISANIDMRSKNQLELRIDFTLGSLTSADVLIEFSSDGTDFYERTILQPDFVGSKIDVTTGPYNFTADAKAHILVELKDRFIRISARGNGTVAGSSMRIRGGKGVS